MAKRLTRKLTDVAKEVEQQLKAHYNITQKELDAWRTAARLSQPFPQSKMVETKALWIDYEVQRDVLHKHIINIMKKWDSRICLSNLSASNPSRDYSESSARSVAGDSYHTKCRKCGCICLEP
jgi:hypothetical protein